MKQTVLITGATSGIGRDLAELFARDGYDVVAAARSEEELQAVKRELETKYGIRAWVISMDLSVTTAPSLLIEWLLHSGIHVDVLVNNAGFGVHGCFAETPIDDELKMIDLHVRTMTELTKHLLPKMIERNRGGMINVVSTAAFQPGPFMAVYYATKSYALSFSEALTFELRDTGVHVTALCPGPTETRFSNRAGMTAVSLFSKGLMQSRHVAHAGFKGFRRGRTIVIPGLRNRIMALAIRFTPRIAVLHIVKYLHRKM